MAVTVLEKVSAFITPRLRFATTALPSGLISPFASMPNQTTRELAGAGGFGRRRDICSLYFSEKGGHPPR
jgi:hypothetical protein